MKVAGKLIVLTGILLLLAFAFQVPYLYHLIRSAARVQVSLVSAVLWRLGLIAGGVLLIQAGKRIQRYR
jgi:hypothetical protein